MAVSMRICLTLMMITCWPESLVSTLPSLSSMENLQKDQAEIPAGCGGNEEADIMFVFDEAAFGREESTQIIASVVKELNKNSGKVKVGVVTKTCQEGLDTNVNSASFDVNRNQHNVDGPESSNSFPLRQWATKVVAFSSQYHKAGWFASQILGQPNVYPRHGDLQGAWASSVRDKNQFIELEFEFPVKPTAINIYETYNPGGVVSVKARGPNHKWTEVWSKASPTRLRESRIFSPPIPNSVSGLTINQLRIEVDCTAAETWVEIDAVELVGIKTAADDEPIDNTLYFEYMKLLINNTLYSDVELQIDKSTVYAHKAILAARSPFFAKMFEHGKDDEVHLLNLPNTSEQDIIAAFTFLYINRLPSDCSIETLLSVVKMAKTLEIPVLKVAALYKLTEVMSYENVVSIFMSLEKDPTGDEVRFMCIKFMAENLKAMSHVSHFEKLPQKYLVEVVQHATAD